jgi:CheY-like chemotaxis protein
MDLYKAAVLIVEDDPDSQEIIWRILRHMGTLTSMVATSEDAIRLLEVQQYHLAVIDLALPKLDGWGLLNYIRHYPPIESLATIAITAYNAPGLEAKALEAGFTAYLPKPLDTLQFIYQVQHILANL